MKYKSIKPIVIGEFRANCSEMMFYQYLPIKLAGHTKPIMEDRLSCFSELIGMILCDFIGVYGLDKYIESNIYLTAKNLFQKKDCSYNRMGYHSDGFMTNDINYLWCNKFPTVFNIGEFDITPDDTLSLQDMEEQALPENDISFPENSVVRITQDHIHRVAQVTEDGLRAFVKVSFSTGIFNLKGNSHNYMLNYKWDMIDRALQRNMEYMK